MLIELERSAANALAESTRHPRLDRAARDVLDALASLLTGDSADAVYAEARAEANTTTWEVAALAGDLFIWVTAYRKGTAWCLQPGFHGYESAHDLRAWARPIRSVEGVSITGIERGTEASQIQSWSWRTGYIVSFNTGNHAEFQTWNEGTQAFIRDLLSRL